MAQSFVGPVVPVHEPLIEEILQLGDGVARLAFDVSAAACDVGAGVARQMLTEQSVDRPEGTLHDARGYWPTTPCVRREEAAQPWIECLAADAARTLATDVSPDAAHCAHSRATELAAAQHQARFDAYVPDTLRRTDLDTPATADA
ncbi:hypothetical protein [Streptomyces sp. NBC_01591]|uniref:hypothetical protein n=1 Tax=Streptomyces sp. NBC_01591 TaxID=2975888 RepID=UPI003FA38C37